MFQDDDESRLFLDRFLSIFQTTFDGMDNLLDNLWQLFDPYLVPAAFLPWLAAWVAVPITGLTLAQQRTVLANAFATYQNKGTIAGLTKGDYGTIQASPESASWNITGYGTGPLCR